MSKFLALIIFIVIIEIAMTIFITPTDAEYTAGVMGENSTSLVMGILNPEQWDSTPWISYMRYVFAIVGAVALGSTLFIKSEWPVYAAVAGFSLSFVLTIIRLYQKTIASGIMGVGSPNYLAVLIFGGFLVVSFIIIFDWARGIQ